MEVVTARRDDDTSTGALTTTVLEPWIQPVCRDSASHGKKDNQPFHDQPSHPPPPDSTCTLGAFTAVVGCDAAKCVTCKEQFDGNPVRDARVGLFTHPNRGCLLSLRSSSDGCHGCVVCDSKCVRMCANNTCAWGAACTEHADVIFDKSGFCVWCGGGSTLARAHCTAAHVLRAAELDFGPVVPANVTVADDVADKLVETLQRVKSSDSILPYLNDNVGSTLTLSIDQVMQNLTSPLLRRNLHDEQDLAPAKVALQDSAAPDWI